MRICHVAFLLVLSCNVLAYDPDTCFPGNFQELSSPSGKHILLWEEPKGEDEEHHLFYSVQGAEPQELFSFSRSVCIFWSPDEKYFSITDNIGSNVAETYIYKVNDLGHRINVSDLLPEKILKHLGKGLWHGYVVGLTWNNEGLFVRVFGDKDEAPQHFDVTLKCFINQDKWVCREENAKPAAPTERQ